MLLPLRAKTRHARANDALCLAPVGEHQREYPMKLIVLWEVLLQLDEVILRRVKLRPPDPECGKYEQRV